MKENPGKHVGISVLALLFFIMADCAVTQTPAERKRSGSYVVDPVHSSLVFRVKHLGITYIYGRFNNLTGDFVIDDDRPANNSLNMSVKTADVDTGNTKRDDHLKNPDFFYAEQFPAISFKSKSLKKLSKNLYEIVGELNLHGVQRMLKAKIRQTGFGKHPSGEYRIGLESSFTLRRSDFRMTHMLGGVSDEVLLIVTVEGIQQ
ncbi:MAG: YceI family protein [Deltaproteobacteria bacterium]|nr:YceI family protein [Deltaproteobacteria bacterium]